MTALPLKSCSNKKIGDDPSRIVVTLLRMLQGYLTACRNWRKWAACVNVLSEVRGSLRQIPLRFITDTTRVLGQTGCRQRSQDTGPPSTIYQPLNRILAQHHSDTHNTPLPNRHNTQTRRTPSLTPHRQDYWQLRRCRLRLCRLRKLSESY